MDIVVLSLLLLGWVVTFAAGVGEVSDTPSPVTHRPGAAIVPGPKVSPTQENYRILIDLPIYDYCAEFSALQAFKITTNESRATLENIHGGIFNQSTPAVSNLKTRLILLFQDLSVRLSRTLADLQNKRAVLMTLQTIPTAPESPEQSRNSRDIADYIGLASTGEMAELHHWVTQFQNSETKLAHSAQQELSYLNHTVRRLNAQEDRINQLAFIDLKWENTMRSLQKSRADVSEYLELHSTDANPRSFGGGLLRGRN